MLNLFVLIKFCGFEPSKFIDQKESSCKQPSLWNSLKPHQPNANVFRTKKSSRTPSLCILHCLLTIFAGEVRCYCWSCPWRKPLRRTSSTSHPVKSHSQQKLLSFNKTSLFYWPDWRGLNEMKMLHGVATRQRQASREFRTIVERHLWRENAIPNRVQ